MANTISQKRIEKHLNFLNEIGKSGGESLTTLARKHKSTHAGTIATKMGYVKRTPNGYVPSLPVFEPIHARKLITEIDNYIKDHAGTAKEKPTKADAEKPKPTQYRTKKEFSVLWGLIKIKY